MARLFDDGSNQYLRSTNPLVTEAPFAISAKCYFDDLSAFREVVFISDTATADSWFQFYCSSAAGELIPRISAASGGSTSHASATANITVANEWHILTAVLAAVDDRRILLDGGNKGTSVDNRVPLGIDTINIGRYEHSGGTGGYMSGGLGEIAIWDLAVWPGATAADRADSFEAIAVPALAKNFSPLFFQLGLISYWALVRDEDQDRVGGCDLTAYNTPSVMAHPPVIYPAPAMFYPKAAAPPAGNPWYAYAQQ